MNTLDRVESTVVKEIIRAGIKDNEITDNNDYTVQNEDENIVYLNHAIRGVFYEVYGPMRDKGGSGPLGLYMHQENVSSNKNLINVYVVTHGEGLITLAAGRREKMEKLLETLSRLVSKDSIKNLVKQSYKEGKEMYCANNIETLDALNDIPWIPRSFRADIQHSGRNELTD